MECVPTASVLVLRVATPVLFNVPVPILLEPSLKVTVPVGVDPEWATTFAVKVTAVPCVEGFSDEVRVVVVVASFTVCESAAEVLAW
jgi:hypothetical protein